GSNELISANPDLTDSTRGPSRLPAISGNARWIAYETVAGNGPLTNGLNNPFSLVAYDRWSRTNLLIASVGPANKPGPPSNPVWSADGRYVAFQSSWPDPAIANSSLGQIYFRDLAKDSNVLVSLNQSGTAAGNRLSWNPLISADGTKVLYLGAAGDLVTNIASIANLFLWDAASRSNALISVSTNGAGLNNVRQAALSANGRFSTFLNAANLYLCDLSQQSPTLIASNAWSASLSADGRFVAFESASPLIGNDTNSVNDIYVFDQLSNTLALASVNHEGTASGNGKSFSPVITPDGRYVIFTSQATDLVANDTNGFSDVFLRDMVAGTTMLLSVNFDGTSSGNRLSGNPVLSADGNVLIFESFCSDLGVGDFNGTKDIFAVRLNSGDANFRAFVLWSPDVTNGVMVLWNAVPGRTYRVEFKNRIEDPNWTELPGEVIPTSTTGAKLDSSTQTAEKRFYRVVSLR
ncbi:MAG TPA: hypothetical protein VFA77_09940, partial [Candidatus Eisenbacteria bacterium]|nr:hypothetical protein [Candidatus Eisenbacteria bacterium]